MIEALNMFGAFAGGMTGATVIADTINDTDYFKEGDAYQISNKKQLGGILSTLLGATTLLTGIPLISPLVGSCFLSLGIREFIEGYVTNKEAKEQAQLNQIS